MGGVLSISYSPPFLCSVLNFYETIMRGVGMRVEACASIGASEVDELGRLCNQGVSWGAFLAGVLDLALGRELGINTGEPLRPVGQELEDGRRGDEEEGEDD